MASGLPIGYKTPVRFYALMQSPYWEPENHIICNTLDLWVPLHVGIKAHYNDYGSVTDVEDTEVTQSFLAVLAALAKEHDGGLVKPAVVANMPLEEWLSALWCGGVEVYEPEAPLWDPSLLPSLERIQKFIPPDDALDDLITSLRGTSTKTSHPKLLRRSTKTFRASWAMIREDVYQELLKIADGVEEPYVPSAISLYPTFGLCPEGSPDRRSEHFQINNALYKLCRLWMAGHTVGPQCPEWGPTLQFAEALVKISSAKLAEEEVSCFEEMRIL